MKSFKAVEETRRDYHANSALNSVHRSSLLAPVLPAAELDITFLNHFLLKRGYKNVGCRVTEIDAMGRRIQARMLHIDEPRVYTLRLSEIAHKDTTDCMVEFFAGENLFIPFPAVIVNHRGNGFLNSVHAYNRVLNDVFEDEAINATTQREAAIDVRLDDQATTFLLFNAGQSACRGGLQLQLDTNGNHYECEINLDVPRFGHQIILLRDAFPNLKRVTGGVLTVAQPKQSMFYGRMLTGQVAKDGAFSANHSYYDSSTVGEYWDDARPSARLFPFLASFDTRIRFYPIVSPGRLRIEITPRDGQGRVLTKIDAGMLQTPSASHVDISINEACQKAGIDLADVSAFGVSATPEGGKTPTRINHQLVFVSGALESSINVSLNNPNVFMPPGKTGFSWGQVPVSNELDSFLAVTTNLPDGEACEVEATFYNSSGKIGDTSIKLPGGSARALRSQDFLPSTSMPPDGAVDYVWFTLRSARADVFGYSVSRHRRTGHCSGEHGF